MGEETTQPEGEAQMSGLEELAGKYLTFKVGEEEYGADILQVQEIIKVPEITKVPHAPQVVRGIINLRGKVIPVIDLRLKFGMQHDEISNYNRIIVVYVQLEGETTTLGMLVDEVSEVCDITAQQMEPLPAFDTQVQTEFIAAVAKLEDRVAILLDMDRLLTQDESAGVQQAASK